MSLPIPADMWDTPEHAQGICAAALGRGQKTGKESSIPLLAVCLCGGGEHRKNGCLHFKYAWLFFSHSCDRAALILLSWVLKGQWCCSALGGLPGAWGETFFMEKNGCYLSFSLTLSTKDSLKTENSSPELPGEMTLDLLPQRQGRCVQKLMQSCGDTKSFVLKTLPWPFSAHEISLGHKSWMPGSVL